MRFPLLFAVGLLFACLPHCATAQALCPPVGIETDPPNATTNPGGRLNTFNWYYGDYSPNNFLGRRYSLSSSVSTQQSIELPWQQPDNINMERFQGKNDIPANGWELIKRDLGYDDGGFSTPTRNPYVILYNRYMGVLRVFVTVQKQLTNFQFAEVKLVFSTAGKAKAGTLNRQSALGVALEDTERGLGTEFATISRYLNDGSKWFAADFPIDYDPCICQFDSRLRIEVSLIKTTAINTQSATTGSVTTASDASAGTSSGTPFIKKLNGGINAAGTSFDNV